MINIQTAPERSTPNGRELARRLYGGPPDAPPAAPPPKEHADELGSPPVLNIYPCVAPMLPPHMRGDARFRRRRKRRGGQHRE